MGRARSLYARAMDEPTGQASNPDLSGFTVAITADRRSDDQAVMFARLGATVLQAPVLSTVKVPDPQLLRDRTDELIEQPVAYLIANTGVGIRTWMACADEWGLGVRLREALGATKIAARGPKAAGALTSVGLRTWWRSPSEQLAEVVRQLVAEGLESRRVAYQLHGDDGSEVTEQLSRAGASVVTLPVYQWAPPTDPTPVRQLVERCCAGGVDAVTFTAGPQVRALVQMAEAMDRRGELIAAFNSGEVLAGCIGPVCAAAATGSGVLEPIVPDNWRLGSLVKRVALELSRRRPG